jgi:hypothetical protein
MRVTFSFVPGGIRTAVLTGFVTILVVASAAAQAPAPPLGGAESFAVLAGTAVANTGASTVSGDVGVNAGGTITGFPPGTVATGNTVHIADAVASQAHHDAVLAYQDLAQRTCPAENNLTNENLGGQTLASGVYCFDGNASLTGVLTLTGTGPWIFQVGGVLLVSPGATIATPELPPTDTCRGTSVYWQVAGDDNNPGTPLLPSTIDAGAAMVGNLLALGDVTVATAATVDGRVISLGAQAGGGHVSLTANAVGACSYGDPLPTYAPFKVTGGGGINVPSPNSSDPDATGNGFANYGFNAQPATTTGPIGGNFNYVNHVVAPHIHVNGPVTDVDVLALHPDGTPKTARFSGTCDRLLPACTYSVEVEDNGEPGRDDRFGVTIVSNGTVVESRAIRVVRNGNIQFHFGTLETEVQPPDVAPGQTLRVTARLRPDRSRVRADAYVVLQLPGGQLMSWTGSGLVPGLVPIARNFVPVNLDQEIARLVVPPGTPPGTYIWHAALTETGTMNLLTGISQQQFTVRP